MTKITPTPPVAPTPDNHRPGQRVARRTLDATGSAGLGGLIAERLGGFEVQEVIGRGGMGIVLGGVHVEQRVPVAIKLITQSGQVTSKLRRRLRNEVQAVAGLNHPGIVMVFDYGEVDRDCELRTGGTVERGTPYYVMERTFEGTLCELAGRLRWRQVKTILLDLLDALAHAHAAGVVHRDIKPDNVLLGRWGGRLIPKLADFGIAFAVEGDATANHCIGTPRYMAPEQIDQPWRTHGPWSDLYSLGCIAYELLSGRELFAGSDLMKIYQDHFRDSHPRLDPVVTIPPAFQGWLDKILHRDHRQRFQTAAEAARALVRIDDEGVPDASPPDPVAYDFSELTPVLDPLLSRSRRHRSSQPATEFDTSLEELPKRWPRPSVQPMSIRIVGAGLGLYGLRAIPLIGRDQELDRIWQTFCQVEQDHQNRTVVLRGAQGYGKTRLVEWFAQRLREFGAATVLRATHSDEGGPADGLAAMLDRHFRTVGADASEVQTVIREAMEDTSLGSTYDWQMMTHVVRPALDGELEAATVHVSDPSQRYAVIRRYLRQLAQKQPVVIWCDDAHWGSDAIEFAKFMHRVQPEEAGPILLVLSVTDDGLAERDDERELLAELLEQARVDELALDPLESVDHERLVEELLLLEGDLARDVVRRTSGNPLFAVELIGDWVERGVLEVGEHGFVLPDDVEPSIPDHLYDVWVQRLEALLEDFGQDAREALELAAALGQSVQRTEWEAVCDLANVYLDDSLSAELIERRFAKRTDGGWMFAHAMIRESIERVARDANRWIDHRRTCATMLESVYGIDKSQVAERFGRYAMSAHEFGRAFDPLLDEALRRRERGEYRRTQQLLSACLRCLEKMRAAEDDPRWGQVWVSRARTYLNSRQPRQAHRWAQRALEASTLHEWPDIRPQAMSWLALAMQWLGDTAASDYLGQAYKLVEQATAAHQLSSVYGPLAHGLTRRGDFSDAERLLERGLQVAHREQDINMLANNHYLRCRAAFFRQQWDTALEHATEAHALFETQGNLPGSVGCREAMAEIHRLSGQPARAEELYRSCLELQRTIGASMAISQTNLANILLQKGQAEEAEKLFLMAASAFEAAGRRMFQTVAQAGMLACASVLQWWGAVQEHLEPIQAFLEQTQACERDVAELLEFAGGHLHEGGQFRDAVNVYTLAAEQWRRLDEPARAEAVTEKIARWT
jgi:eukaryotic-like serine/threonine-protein kinase